MLFPDPPAPETRYASPRISCVISSSNQACSGGIGMRTLLILFPSSSKGPLPSGWLPRGGSKESSFLKKKQCRRAFTQRVGGYDAVRFFGAPPPSFSRKRQEGILRTSVRRPRC